VHGFRFAWDDRSFRLGASVGVVPISVDSDDVTAVLSAADSACAAAKERAQPRARLSDERHRAHARRREMQWAARINTALEEVALRAVPPGHPAAAARRERRPLRAAAAHARRARQPDLARVFIAAAERYGKTTDIDRWVIQNALRWLMNDSEERARSRCARSTCRAEPRRRQVPAFVIEELRTRGHRCDAHLLRDHGDRGDRKLQQANRFITALRELGCKFALDRLRHRPLVVRLPEALPGRFPQDRRQLREGDAA
jgi:predicted signal transduction protein with EAL and GGDEF domain